MSKWTGLGAILMAMLLLALPAATTQAEGVTAPKVTHVDIRFTSSAYTDTLGSFDGHLVVGNIGSTCQLATIQPTTLRIVSDRSESCDDPLLYGENVMPVESIDPIGSNYGHVRISVRNPETGSFRLGPVVMRYGNFSDGRPEWIYGGGYLWLYDVGTQGDTVPPQLSAEVLRISLPTGKVLATVEMPPLSRISLAADNDGLWSALSQETGTGPNTTPELLYFLPVMATQPEGIQQREEPGQYVNWVAAAGHTAWANIETNFQASTDVTETIPTPSSKPLVVTDATGPPTPSNIGEGPFDAPPVLYARRFGLIAALPGWLGTVGKGGAPAQQIVKLDSTTGGFADVVSFKTADPGVVQANIVYNGALYLLENSPQSSHASLYRIRL